jgi:hypothetical protein
VIYSWNYTYGRLLRLAKTRELFQEQRHRASRAAEHR